MGWWKSVFSVSASSLGVDKLVHSYLSGPCVILFFLAIP